MAAQTGATTPAFAQFARPDEITPRLRGELTDCWTAVTNAGGAVIAASFLRLPVSTGTVESEVDRLVGELDPRRGRLLAATLEGALAGWLLLRRAEHPLVAHCGVVNHVQTHPRVRGLGVGAYLMNRVPGIARDELGLERLQLAVRSGAGLEEFYRKLGWTEIGRWPGALRVAPGDDRDEILMSLTL